MLHCTVLHCTVLHRTVLHRTVLHPKVLHCCCRLRGRECDPQRVEVSDFVVAFQLLQAALRPDQSMLVGPSLCRRIRQSSVELLGDLLFKVGSRPGCGRGKAHSWLRMLGICRLLPAAQEPHQAVGLSCTLSNPCPTWVPTTGANCLSHAQVAGTTGRIQQDLHNEEEEGISAEAHGQAIVEALGIEKRVCRLLFQNEMLLPGF